MEALITAAAIPHPFIFLRGTSKDVVEADRWMQEMLKRDATQTTTDGNETLPFICRKNVCLSIAR